MIQEDVDDFKAKGADHIIGDLRLTSALTNTPLTLTRALTNKPLTLPLTLTVALAPSIPTPTQLLASFNPNSGTTFEVVK